MDKLAFLNKVRSLPLPPVKNILNVAVQTARQTMPDKPNKGEYVEPNGSPPVPLQRSDENMKSPPQRMEHHELNPFNTTNPFDRSVNENDGRGNECTSFMGDYGEGYQRSENYMNRQVEKQYEIITFNNCKNRY